MKLLSLFLLAVLFIISCNPGQDLPARPEKPDKAEGEIERVSLEQETYDSFGFLVDSLNSHDHKVQRNESLYLILQKFNLSPREIYEVTEKARKVINVRNFKPGQNYRTYTSSDSTESLDRLVWQPNLLDYVVFDWKEEDGSVEIYKASKTLVTEKNTAYGEVASSLYEAISDEGNSPLLAYEMSDIFAWQIDFFRLRKGDSFRVLHENRYVEDEFLGMGRILAAEFTHRSETFEAYYFSHEDVEGFFDEEGRSVQKALLKAPFKYNQRISSHFSHNRFHPILKRNIPHYGVDYAAPHGTPVLSVGDGTVTEAQYRGANGNIVKVRHNNTYRTAYLHLKGFARGIRPGAKVKQGEVIGYVGNTGRSTGTHLDYRIYKNNKPVNPLRLELPASDSIPEEYMSLFKQVRDSLRQEMQDEQDSSPSLVIKA